MQMALLNKLLLVIGPKMMFKYFSPRQRFYLSDILYLPKMFKEGERIADPVVQFLPNSIRGPVIEFAGYCQIYP